MKKGNTKFWRDFIVAVVVIFIVGIVFVWLWKNSIPAIFPRLVEKGYISAEIPYRSAVALIFMCNILFKPALKNKMQEGDDYEE